MSVTIAQDLSKEEAEALAAYMDNYKYLYVAYNGVECPRGQPAFKTFIPSLYGATSNLRVWWVRFEPPPPPWHRLMDYDHIKDIAAAFCAGLKARA
jgi:nucleoside-diphosphate-sugar epimerase